MTRRATRLPTVVLLIGSAGSVLGVGSFATVRAAATPDSSAPNGAGGARWLLFLVCLGSFAVGYGVVLLGGKERKSKAERERQAAAAATSRDTRGTSSGKPPRLRRLGRMLAHVVVVVALFLGFLVAVYEAFGMASFHGWSPFTSYVRAATVYAPQWSALYGGIGSFLVAYWLMPRTTHRRNAEPMALSGTPTASPRP